jgi:hypothetical protein
MSLQFPAGNQHRCFVLCNSVMVTLTYTANQSFRLIHRWAWNIDDV